MPYVKISDPNVIDLAAWHQVINVVNQHSDSISSITNNLGGSAPVVVDWNGENDFVHQFDPGSQKILYGRHKLITDYMSDIYDNQIFYGSVTFVDDGATAFSSRPIVTATIQFGHTTIEALDDSNHNIILNLFNITGSQFKFRVTRAISDMDDPTPPPPLSGSFYLNWTATGPK